MSIASSQGSQGWEDENVEESEKAAEKRKITYHIQRLEELSILANYEEEATKESETQRKPIARKEDQDTANLTPSAE